MYLYIYIIYIYNKHEISKNLNYFLKISNNYLVWIIILYSTRKVSKYTYEWMDVVSVLLLAFIAFLPFVPNWPIRIPHLTFVPAI